MFSDEKSAKVLETLATASPARAPARRRQAVVSEVCADLGLSEPELKQALEELERAGDIRRAYLDLGCVVVTHTGRLRAERLAQARACQERNRRGADAIDISMIIGGA